MGSSVYLWHLEFAAWNSFLKVYRFLKVEYYRKYLIIQVYMRLCNFVNRYIWNNIRLLPIRMTEFYMLRIK